MDLAFTPRDFEQIEQKGILPAQVKEQIQCFEEGIPFVQLVRPATIGDGILSWNEDEANQFASIFEQNRHLLHIQKFVPASGAASRMFKPLFEFASQYIGMHLSFHKDFPEVKIFMDNLQRFAFYDDLSAAMQKNGLDLRQGLETHQYNTISNYVIHKQGLSYGETPKALISFHRYPNQVRTALEEHLTEGALYGQSEGKPVDIHFTVSPEHKDAFLQKLSEVQQAYEAKLNVVFDISFSEQHASTDTIAVDLDNYPFRDEQDRLVFRPGGHGALLKNLNDSSADIIFVKNIDNVQVDRNKPSVILYKKALAGLLIDIRSKVFNFLENIDRNTYVDEMSLIEIETFFYSSLMIPLSDRYYNLPFDEKLHYLHTKLNRPIRVCGMVKNEGEPGGGPFWVHTEGAEESLQIVETSQVNMKDEEQRDILKQSSHFNPVDLVCSIQNYKGEKIDLQQFVDAKGGFISTKSQNGKALKALELPGLWNAGMSDWITIFVETPMVTFSPVKTINDLLREEHQA